MRYGIKTSNIEYYDIQYAAERTMWFNEFFLLDFEGYSNI